MKVFIGPARILRGCTADKTPCQKNAEFALDAASVPAYDSDNNKNTFT
jgi:hypothetical protein